VPNFGFIIDNRRCIGCHACTVACKSEHEVAVGVNRTWVKYIEKGQFPESRRLFSVMRCNHCDDAPCVDICPVTALYTREDGIVDFDNRRCIGCKACMQACPYDALYIDPNTHTAAKCNYCAHRVDIGLEPACVNVCPTQAIISGDLDDPTSKIAKLKSREVVTVRKPEKATRPALFYIDGKTAQKIKCDKMTAASKREMSKPWTSLQSIPMTMACPLALKLRMKISLWPGKLQESNWSSRRTARSTPSTFPKILMAKFGRLKFNQETPRLKIRGFFYAVANPFIDSKQRLNWEIRITFGGGAETYSDKWNSSN